ncbi:MAG: hypothetical protein KBT06_03445 [Prevotellaceae bacterium]|nr:hypothetical protein [Candidatus Colivivens equi]
MLKKTITYKDFDGNERTEDFYFHISEAEAIKMELGKSGGLSARINQIISAQDVPEIMEVFEDLIKKSYGVKSLDGREFIKSEELYRSFAQTNAYSKFFMELCTEEGAAADFVNAILPNGGAVITENK